MAEFLSSILSWQLIVSVVVILVVLHLLLVLAGGGTYLERKISAYIQDRIGPNRVGLDLGLPALKFLKGLFGLGQPLADGLKFILKEDYTPRGADKTLFTLAAVIVVVPVMIAFAIIPWGGKLALPEVNIFGVIIKEQVVNVTAANINVGLIYLLAVASLGIYAITLAGWSSNNKYAFLGGLRASAQMLSYEIPMGLAVLMVLLVTGSLMPDAIVAFQANHGWLILFIPIVAVIFFICALAEGNRAPFDNAECEQELVAGWHTEYSAMRLGLLLLSEYIHLFTGAAFFSVLFLGAYHLPLSWVGGPVDHLLHPDNTSILGVLAKFHVILGKTVLVVFVAMLVRWTIPRLKFNQVMGMAWNGVIPLSIALVVTLSIMIALGWTQLWQMAAMNLGIGIIFLALAPASTGTTENKKLRMAGSRFYPMAGERVLTAAPAEARIDHPHNTL